MAGASPPFGPDTVIDPAMTSPPSSLREPALSSERLPGLDLLRGIAALCVLGLHTQSIFRDHPSVFAKGYLAVDLFFMLSGYVMARTYEPRLARGLSPVSFVLARYWRLWPIMAIGSLIGLPKLFIEAPNLWVFSVTAVFNFLLMPIPGKGPGFPLNIPAWSIYFELTANLLHGLLLWRFGVRWLGLLIALMLPIAAWVGMSHGSFDVGAGTDQYFSGLPRVTLSYVIGIVLFRVWRDGPSIPVPPLLAFVAMPLLFASAWWMGIDGWRFDLAFIVIACPLLIAGGLRYRSRDGTLTTAVVTGLGALSFPLYAVHMPVLQGMRLLEFGWLSGALAALACGIALTLAVEAVGQRRKRRKRMTA